MTDHPLGTPPMRRKFAKPPAPPASSCPRCYRNGTPADNQLDDHGHQRARTIRFYCESCLTDWSTDAAQAHAHGRFLARIDHTAQRDV